MSELIVDKTKVNSVFQLIGIQENDITKSIAWAMAKCPGFLKCVINTVLGVDIDTDKIT